MPFEPQYVILLGVVTATLAAGVVLGIRAKISKQRIVRTRNRIEISTIHDHYYPNMDLAEFVHLWTSLSDTLKIDGQVLSPTDNLKELEKTYALSDQMWDDIEDWLRAQGISEVSNKFPKTIGELVEIVISGRTKK